MPRCDLHGPYTALEAARMVRGEWTPERSGYLCPDCATAVKNAAQNLANEIDRRAAEEVMKVYGH